MPGGRVAEVNQRVAEERRAQNKMTVMLRRGGRRRFGVGVFGGRLFTERLSRAMSKLQRSGSSSLDRT